MTGNITIEKEKTLFEHNFIIHTKAVRFWFI